MELFLCHSTHNNDYFQGIGVRLYIGVIGKKVHIDQKERNKQTNTTYIIAIL